MNEAVLVWELPWPSTSLWRNPWIEMESSHARIYLPYARDPGTYEWGLLDFPGAYEFRYVHEFASEGLSKGCYDRLVELPNSPAAARVLKGVSFSARAITALHHYRLFLDDTGCFDIIATGWSYAANVAQPPARSFPTER